MVSLLDINKSLVTRLRYSLRNTPFNNVPIVESDLEEGFERPSLKVEVSSNIEKVNTDYVGRTILVDVYFFASDIKKYKIENLKIQDILERTFLGSYEILEGCNVNVFDIECNIVDTVLIVSFEFEIINQELNLEDENAEYMQDLEINI